MRVIFDFPCSLTFREYEAELNGITLQRCELPKVIPLNEEDILKKSKGIKILEFLLGINIIPYPRSSTQKKKLKGVPL